MKDFDHYMRAWNGKLGQQALAQLEKNDLKYLATIYRGLRQTTAKKPLYTPADAYNLKLRLPHHPHLDGRLEGDRYRPRWGAFARALSARSRRARPRPPRATCHRSNPSSLTRSKAI